MSDITTIPTPCPAGAFLVICGRVEVPKVPGSEANDFSHSDGRGTIGTSGDSSGSRAGLLTLFCPG